MQKEMKDSELFKEAIDHFNAALSNAGDSRAASESEVYAAALLCGIAELEAALDNLRELLSMANCSDLRCVGGTIPEVRGTVDDVEIIGEAYPCEWCAAKEQALDKHPESDPAEG